MESKDLKITAADYVMESKMTNPAKLQMLNFIQKEADDHQLMSLMLDGQIVKLDEQAKQIVEDRFMVSELGVIGNIVSLLLLPGASIVWRGIAAAASSAHRKCGILKISNQRDACLAKTRIEEATKKIAIMKKALPSCSKHRDPKMCTAGLNAVIDKENFKIAKAKKKLSKLPIGRTVGSAGTKTKII